jgi:hypothetical protein
MAHRGGTAGIQALRAGCGGRISRILSRARRLSDDHFSGTPVARRLERPTRKSVTGRASPCGPGPPESEPQPLLPYLVLLQVGFTEPGRSPDLLVSSYLTVSPLPPRRKRPGGGLFSVALSLPEIGRWALPTTSPCGVRTFLRGTTPIPCCHAIDRPGDHPARHNPPPILRSNPPSCPRPSKRTINEPRRLRWIPPS